MSVRARRRYRGNRRIDVPPSARFVALLVLAAALAHPFLDGLYPLDLHVYLCGGHAIVGDRPLYGSAVSVHGYPFTYPPLASYPFAALSLLPLGVAITLVVLCFYVALWLVFRACSGTRLRAAAESWRSWAAAMIVLAVQPTWATLHDGQVNMAVAALVLCDFLLLARRPGNGVLVGLAVAIKLTPAIFIVYAVCNRQYTLARNAVAAFVVALVYGFAATFSDARAYWFDKLFDTTRVGDASRVSNQSILGFLLRATTSDSLAHVLWVPLGLLAAGVALRLAVSLSRLGEQVLGLGVVGSLGCLLSPISWTHHWVWVIPCVLGATGARALVWTRSARIYGALGVGVFLVTANRLGTVAQRVPVLGNLCGAAFVVTALAGWAVLDGAVRRARRGSAPARVSPGEGGPPGNRTRQVAIAGSAASGTTSPAGGV